MKATCFNMKTPAANRSFQHESLGTPRICKPEAGNKTWFLRFCMLYCLKAVSCLDQRLVFGWVSEQTPAQARPAGNRILVRTSNPSGKRPDAFARRQHKPPKLQTGVTEKAARRKSTLFGR